MGAVSRFRTGPAPGSAGKAKQPLIRDAAGQTRRKKNLLGQQIGVLRH